MNVLLIILLLSLVLSCGGRGSPCPRKPTQGAINDGGKGDSQKCEIK